MAAAGVRLQDDLPAILVTDLNYKAGFFGPLILHDVDLKLPQGSRCLLCGANGSGKSTLLQVLGGKHMVPEDAVRVMGRPAFHDLGLTMTGDLAYLGAAWRAGTLRDAPLKGDLSAEKLIYGVAGADAARRERLIRLLDIDLTWRMLTASDGQRRRVQIAMGLLMPYKVLLLDEITVDMDVLGRLDLLRFFKQECEERGASIIYATHIFDGLEGWPTHIAYMERGGIARGGQLSSITELASCDRLLTVVEGWLRQEKETRRTDGAQANVADPAAGQKLPGIIVNESSMPNKHLAWYR